MIIYIQEGQRRIPIQYACRVRGRRMYQGGATFLPLRVNQAGVIPIIFAVSILLFPTQLASYFASPNPISSRTWQLDRGQRRFSPSSSRTSSCTSCYDGLHVLLYGVHVQARRDGRAAAQERRVHPGHPTGPPDAGLPRPGRHPDDASPARSSSPSWPSRHRSCPCSSPTSPASAWAAPAC